MKKINLTEKVSVHADAALWLKVGRQSNCVLFISVFSEVYCLFMWIWRNCVLDLERLRCGCQWLGRGSSVIRRDVHSLLSKTRLRERKGFRGVAFPHFFLLLQVSVSLHEILFAASCGAAITLRCDTISWYTLKTTEIMLKEFLYQWSRKIRHSIVLAWYHPVLFDCSTLLLKPCFQDSGKDG